MAGKSLNAKSVKATEIDYTTLLRSGNDHAKRVIKGQKVVFLGVKVMQHAKNGMIRLID